MLDHLIYDSDFEDIEPYLSSKGWCEVQATIAGVLYTLHFFDPVRLGQDIAGTFGYRSFWFEPNVVVIAEVDRNHMEEAFSKLVTSAQVRQLVPDAQYAEVGI